MEKINNLEELKEYVKNYMIKKQKLHYMIKTKTTKNGLFIYGLAKNEKDRVYTYISKDENFNKKETIDFINSMLDTFIEENNLIMERGIRL